MPTKLASTMSTTSKSSVQEKSIDQMHRDSESGFGPAVYILLGGLLIGNILYFIGVLAKYADGVVWQQLLFRLDFRYWPFEAVYFLWFVFIWLLIDAVTFRQRMRPIVDEEGKANTVRVVVFVLKLAVLAAFVAPLLNPMRIRLIRRLLTDHYFVPMTQFFHDGSLSWKLMISPLLAVIVIGFLLHLKRKFQNSKHHTP